MAKLASSSPPAGPRPPAPGAHPGLSPPSRPRPVASCKHTAWFTRPAASRPIGPAAPPGPWLSLWLIHPSPGPFTGGRGPPVRAGHERWWPVVNGGAQYSKACEGASLPWVQIPPPPPLTCMNIGLCRRQTGASCSPGLIWWSQLRAACGPAAGISRGCCAWSRTSRPAWTQVCTPLDRAPVRSRNLSAIGVAEPFRRSCAFGSFGEPHTVIATRPRPPSPTGESLRGLVIAAPLRRQVSVAVFSPVCRPGRPGAAR